MQLSINLEKVGKRIRKSGFSVVEELTLNLTQPLKQENTRSKDEGYCEPLGPFVILLMLNLHGHMSCDNIVCLL